MTDHNNSNNTTNNKPTSSTDTTNEKQLEHAALPRTDSSSWIETKRMHASLGALATQTCEGYLKKKCVLVYWVKNPNTNAPQAVPTVWKYVNRYFFVVGDTLCYTKTKKDREKRKKYKVITHLTQIKALTTTQTKIQIVVHTGHQINLKSPVPEDILKWVTFLAPFKTDSSPTNSVILTNFPALPRSRITTLARYPLPVVTPDSTQTTTTTTNEKEAEEEPPVTPTFAGRVPVYPTPNTPDLRKAMSSPATLTATHNNSSNNIENNKAEGPVRHIPTKAPSTPIRSTPPVPARPPPPTPARATPPVPSRPIPPRPVTATTATNNAPTKITTKTTLNPNPTSPPARTISSPLNSSPPQRPASPLVLSKPSSSTPVRAAPPVPPRPSGRPVAPVPPRRDIHSSPKLTTPASPSSGDKLIDETMPWKETGTLRPYKPHESSETYIPYDKRTDEEKALDRVAEKKEKTTISTSWSMNNIAEWDDHDTSISSDAAAIMGWDDWDAIFIKSQSLENIAQMTAVN